MWLQYVGETVQSLRDSFSGQSTGMKIHFPIINVRYLANIFVLVFAEMQIT